MTTRTINALEPWMAEIIAGAGPAATRRLARGIAKDLRTSQQDRIAAQKNPDGSSYKQRKVQLRSKKGRIRARQDMFRKLRTNRFLKAKGLARAAVVGFSGHTAAIARVHQEGLLARAQKPGPLVRYPRRVLLGYTGADRAMITDKVLDSVKPKKN